MEINIPGFEGEEQKVISVILAALRFAQHYDESVLSILPSFDVDISSAKCLDNVLDIDELCEALNGMSGKEQKLRPMTIRNAFGDETENRPLCDKCGREKVVADLRNASYCPKCFQIDVSDQLQREILGDYQPCAKLLWHSDGYPIICLAPKDMEHDH